MKMHISRVCTSIYFIRTDAAKKLMLHFVSSRIDYCNYLLLGTSENLFKNNAGSNEQHCQRYP